MYNVRASRDGKTVAAGGQDSVLRAWDQQGKSIVTFAPPPAAQPGADKQAAAEK
jgi:WD40 repeat protein